MGENQKLQAFVRKPSLYLFYHHHYNSPLRYSVYKIDLDLNNAQPPPATATLSPVLEFPNDGEYPTDIRCVHLGGKLYFLGGIRRDLLKTVKDGDDHNSVLPRDVYVLDTITNNFKKMDASLNTGKPDPLVFAANGKLYVLTSTLLTHLPFHDLSRNSKLFSSIDLFECFDPVTNEWKVLDSPPVRYEVRWTGCTVLEKRGQVLLLGKEPSFRGKMVRFVYDVNNNSWTRNNLIDPNVKLMDAAPTGDDGDFYYYGLSSFGEGPMKSKADIFTFDDEIKLDGGPDPVGEDGLVQVSILGEDPEQDSLCQQPYFGGTTTTFMRYIGNNCFCYVAAGMLPRPGSDTPDRYGNYPPDEHTRAITIVLFKERKSQGFQVEILGSQEYVMPAPFYNVAKLAEGIVVNPE